MKKRKKLFIFLGIILVIIIAFRIYLPTLVKDQINKNLNAVEGYSGGVDRVSMQIFRGAVQLHDLAIFEEKSTDPSIPLIDLHHLDFNIHWGALFRGRVVSEIYMDSLKVNFTKREKAEPEEADRMDYVSTLTQMNPIKINIIRIENSEINYIDPTTQPQVNVNMSDFFLEINNLRNVVNKKDTLPSSLNLQSKVLNSGDLHLFGHMNIMREVPDFDMTMELENVNLTRFNKFTEAYAEFTFNEGELGLYTEIAALDGAVNGYVKPVLDNIEIAPAEKDEDFLTKAYEGILDVVAQIFSNPDTDFLGTRVDFEGRIDDPEVEVWDAILTFLRNAFFESISKGFEDVVDFEDLKK
jgi:hypothetical protein